MHHLKSFPAFLAFFLVICTIDSPTLFHWGDNNDPWKDCTAVVLENKIENSFPYIFPRVLLASAADQDSCGQPTITLLIFIFSIALVAIFGALFFITCCIICCVGSGKSNHHAPSSESKPITVVCVNIDQSLLFWRTDKVRMSNAVYQYNGLVRSLIHKYSCYEWVCSGSGQFIVATNSIVSALKFSQHLHHRLMQEPFDKYFDNAYMELELNRQEELGPHTTLATSAFAPEYDLIWNGIRVCIGIHTAERTILIKDNGTGYYDYGGGVGRIAEDVCLQAYGGQTLLTSSAYDAAMKDKKTFSKSNKINLREESVGEVFLNAVGTTVKLYELISVARREFPPLSVHGKPMYAYCGLEKENQMVQAEEAEKRRKRLQEKEKKRHKKRMKKLEENRSNRHRGDRYSDEFSDDSNIGYGDDYSFYSPKKRDSSNFAPNRDSYDDNEGDGWV